MRADPNADGYVKPEIADAGAGAHRGGQAMSLVELPSTAALRLPHLYAWLERSLRKSRLPPFPPTRLRQLPKPARTGHQAAGAPHCLLAGWSSQS